MSKFFSEKLRLLSFFSIIAVLYIHAGFPDEVIKTMEVPVVVRACIVESFCRCAVPLFYAISGYLFFIGINNGLKDVTKKMRKRVRTLVIPYIIAAMVFPLLYIIIEIAGVGGGIVNSESFIKRIENMSLLEIVSSLYYKSKSGVPWAGQLWFLRDLIIIVALMPLIYCIKKYLKYWSLFIFVGLYFAFPQHSFLWGLIWFITGSFFLGEIGKMPQWSGYVLFALFLTTAFFQQYLMDESLKFLRIVFISFGICSMWILYDRFVSKDFCLEKVPMLKFACQFTFFLYLYHEPSYHIIVKGIPLVIGANEVGYTLSFLLSPLLFAPIAIMIGYCIKKGNPRLYGVMVGGR